MRPGDSPGCWATGEHYRQHDYSAEPVIVYRQKRVWPFQNVHCTVTGKRIPAGELAYKKIHWNGSTVKNHTEWVSSQGYTYLKLKNDLT